MQIPWLFPIFIFSLTSNKIPWLLPSLEFPWLFPDHWTPCQGHGRGEHWKSQHGSNILSTQIPFIPCQSALPFLRYSIFKIWPWKSKVKVMGEGNVESHKVGVTTSYWFTSLLFHVNRPFHPWDTAFSKFDLENPRSRSNDHDVAQL